MADFEDLTPQSGTNMTDDQLALDHFGDNAGADDADSDDYDPSFTAEDPLGEPLPFQTSDQITVQSPLDAHPLPPKPTAQLGSLTPLDSAQTTPATTFNPPKMRGGFEVDEDDSDAEEENTKDTPQIYESADGAEGHDAVFTPSDVPVDSPPSAKKANGVALTAQSQDASNSASTAVSSAALLTSTASPQRAATVTPVPATVDTPVQTSSAPENVTNHLAPALSKGRLAHDVVGILQDRIEDDPRGDIEAWLALIEEYKSRNKQDDVRKTYDDFLNVFPICAEQWCAYVRWEEQHDHKFEMENIFKRSLLENANVELWAIYIGYVRRRNSMVTGDVNKAYKIINDAFEFALKQVGMDKNSGRLWQEYVDFIKTGPGVVGGNDWQDKSKMDALRSAYQRAIAVPTSSLNALWKEYDIFETQSNKVNGRKNLQERSPSYMTARSAFTQLQNITKDLDRTSRPKLPPLAGCVGDTEFSYQVSLWRQWLQWEKDDNLVLKDEDLAVYQSRILFVYKQAVMALQFWPEMWFDAAEFCLSAGLETEASKFLKDGAAANPESCLLTFKISDRIESTTTNDDSSDPGAKKRMERVREPYNVLLDALYVLLQKYRRRETVEVQKVQTALVEELVNDGNVDTAEDNVSANTTARRQAAEAQTLTIKSEVERQMAVLKDTISYTWTALVRAVRRIQGKEVMRKVFLEARQRGHITSDVYVEMALIEHHCYNDKLGEKIFERGLKVFANDAKFALAYLKHLISLNDITNARSVFETSVGKLIGTPSTSHAARPLFTLMHEYESRFGDLAQVARLEKRMSEVFSGEPVIQHFANRYNGPFFDPTTVIPIISTTQILAKTFLHQSIETQQQVQAANSPITRLIDSINTNSPKRPFAGDDLDDGPRKMARAESPLKGAAGRKLNQQQQQRHSNGLSISSTQPLITQPPPLPHQITQLLSILPKASMYMDARFEASKMVDLIRDIRLPPSVPLPTPQHPPPTHAPQGWPQQFQAPQPQSMMPPGNYMAGPGIPPQQYGSAPFRYA